VSSFLQCYNNDPLTTIDFRCRRLRRVAAQRDPFTSRGTLDAKTESQVRKGKDADHVGLVRFE